MTLPKVNKYDYINFLIALQKAYSYTETEQVQLVLTNAVVHDAIGL